MKTIFILLIIALFNQYGYSQQTYELLFSSPPEGLESLINAPGEYNYKWSCNGKLLFFWSTKYLKDKDPYAADSRIIRTNKLWLYVAGPFDNNSGIVAIKKVLQANINDINISPDQKKLVIEPYYTWDYSSSANNSGDLLKIYIFNDEVNPLNNFKEIEHFELPIPFYRNRIDNLSWSPSSNEVTITPSSVWIYLYVLENNKLIKLDCPISRDEYKELKKQVMKENGINAKRDAYLSGLSYMIKIVDDNLYALPYNKNLTLTRLKSFGVTKVINSNILNPIYGNKYKLNKYLGKWETSVHFPPDLLCDKKGDVNITIEKRISGGDEKVKGEWGQVTVKKAITIVDYKLTFLVN